MVQIPYEQLTQKDIIIALSIGDGHIHKQNKSLNSYLDVSHSKKQYEYLLWKNDLLIHSGFKSHITKQIKKCNNNSFEIYRLTTKTDLFITEIYNRLYINKKKNMNYILNNLNPFILAVWFMDDGSKKVKKIIKRKSGDVIIFKNGYIDAYMLATNGFSFEDCNNLCQVLKVNYNITGHVQSDRNTPRISISDNASKEIFKNTIYEYVKAVPSMMYKLNGLISYKEAILVDKISGN